MGTQVAAALAGLATGANVAQQAEATVGTIFAWLIAKYFGDDARERIRDQLTNLRINTKERKS